MKLQRRRWVRQLREADEDLEVQAFSELLQIIEVALAILQRLLVP
jgi:hypothetical protein